MSYIRYTRSKDGSEVWESDNSDSAAKDSYYQFLISLEISRRSTIVSQAANIMSAASFLLALMVFVPDILLEYLPLLWNGVMLFCIRCCCLFLLLGLILSLITVNKALSNINNKYNGKYLLSLEYSAQYAQTANQNNKINIWLKWAYISLFFAIVLFLIILLFLYLTQKIDVLAT